MQSVQEFRRQPSVLVVQVCQGPTYCWREAVYNMLSCFLDHALSCTSTVAAVRTPAQHAAWVTVKALLIRYRAFVPVRSLIIDEVHMLIKSLILSLKCVMLFWGTLYACALLQKKSRE